MKKLVTFLKKQPYLLVLIVGFYLLWPLIHPWFPQTVDGEYYSARLANFYISLKEGVFPPRLAPTFYSGLSYPVLNFNYPLPNIIGSIFLLMGFSIQASMKLLISGSYFLGGVGVYSLLNRLFKKPIAAASGSLLYLTAPYHLFDIFHRLSIGEIMMFALVPWVLITLEKVSKSEMSPFMAAYIFGSFFLTHNLFTLLCMPFIGLYVFLYLGKKAAKKNLGALLCGASMSLFFWLPALGEMQYTTLSSSPINNAYSKELLSIEQMLKIPGQYQTTLPETSNGDQPGYAQLGVLIITAVLLLTKKPIAKASGFQKTTAAILLFSFLILWMVTVHSRQMWEFFSFLRYIQHPTRLYFFLVGATAYLGAWVISQIKYKWLVICLLAGLTFSNYKQYNYQPQNFIPFVDEFFYQYPLTSAAGNEFDPIWYDRLKADEYLKDKSQIISTSKPVTIEKLASSHFVREYSLQAYETTTIIEKTLYFPGWITEVDGVKIDTQANASRFFGLVNFDVEAGKHHIKTFWTQQTGYRQWGNSLAIVGILGTLLLKKKVDHEA